MGVGKGEIRTVSWGEMDMSVVISVEEGNQTIPKL